ncbi:Aldo/keto reductase [Lentinula edodes]|uniref:Aldo/keto reductase n=1 Tax=Lentinula edodes TaxID=5353 RepID=UPI001E8DF6DA|nr:Aldo/keto reductase [Lentinula edodes]KAH7878202.1 Aldo/keto reductase [Lentinula edodes]
MAADIPHFLLSDGTKIPSIVAGWVLPAVPKECTRCARKPSRLVIVISTRPQDMVCRIVSNSESTTVIFACAANEKEVGKAIRDSGIPRNEFYITTKLGWQHHRVKESFEESLNNLDCEYIDLYLMHWPQALEPGTNNVLPPEAKPTIVDTWKEMEKLLGTGKVKTLGVSNFSIKTLEQLLPQCSIRPAVNQVEIHPFLPQNALKAFCESQNILLTAYSPLDLPIGLFKNTTIQKLAEKLKVDIGQMLISWGVQRKTVVVAKTENEARLKQNITVVKLSAEDMKILDEVHRESGCHRTLCHADPSRTGGVLFGWTYEQLGWDLVKGGIVPTY